MKRLLPALVLLASVRAHAQMWNWTAGHVYRVAVPGTDIGLLGKTPEAAKALIGVVGQSWADDDSPSRQSVLKGVALKDVVIVKAGTLVGLLSASDSEGLDHTDYAKVRVQSGPLKGGVYYTPYAYSPAYFLSDEPIVLTGAKKIVGTFHESDLETFWDAYEQGDESLWRGYLALGEAVTFPEGTRGVVYQTTETEHTDRLWVRTETGKTVCVRSRNVTTAYGLPTRTARASRKRRKG